MKGLDTSLMTYLITAVIAFGVAALLNGMDNMLVILSKWFPHHEHHSDDDVPAVQTEESLAEQAIAIAAAHSKEK